MRPQYTYMTINIRYSHNTASRWIFVCLWTSQGYSKTRQESAFINQLRKGIQNMYWSIIGFYWMGCHGNHCPESKSMQGVEERNRKKDEKRKWGRSTSELVLQASTWLTIERRKRGGRERETDLKSYLVRSVISQINELEMNKLSFPNMHCEATVKSSSVTSQSEKEGERWREDVWKKEV